MWVGRKAAEGRGEIGGGGESEKKVKEKGRGESLVFSKESVRKEKKRKKNFPTPIFFNKKNEKTRLNVK